MVGYLCCDMRRLLRRFPRWLMVLLAMGALAIAATILGQSGLYGQWSSAAYVSAVKTVIAPLSLIIGVIEMFFIFGDDFKANTLQSAIGAGLPRASLVMSKFVEIVLLSLLDVIIYGLYVLALGGLFNAGLVQSQIGELCIYFLVEWLKAVGYMSLTMPLLFFTRNLGLSLVLYIAIYAKILHEAVRLLLSAKALESLHLSRYTLTSSIAMMQSYLIGGIHSARPALIVLAFCAAGCLASVLLFQKRELNL